MREIRISKSITTRESPSLQKYLYEIGKEPLVSPEEEVTLTIAIRNGDKKALERLVKGNLRFVVSIAKHYQGQGLSLPDLINEGNFGLIRAAERFDETRGFKFISFAVWYIRQSMMQAIADQSRMIRMPMNKVLLKNKIARAHAKLEHELERAPSDEELAEILDLDEKDVKTSLSMNDRHLSLDMPLSEEDDGSLLDVIENSNTERTDHAVQHLESLKHEIRRTLSQLPEKQKNAIRYFFGIDMEHPMSLEDISIKMEITPERVRQIRDQALNKLRTTQSCALLRTFLG